MRYEIVEGYMDGVWGIASQGYVPVSSVKELLPDYDNFGEDAFMCTLSMKTPNTKAVVIPVFEEFSATDVERMGHFPFYRDCKYYPTALDVIGTNRETVLNEFRKMARELDLSFKREPRDMEEATKWRNMERSIAGQMAGRIEKQVRQYMTDTGLNPLRIQLRVSPPAH